MAVQLFATDKDTLLPLAPLAAAVIRPCASTVILAVVYEPAVTAVFAKAMVTAEDPLKLVPESPVPIVKELGVFTLMFVEPLKDTPLIVLGVVRVAALVDVEALPESAP